MAEQSCAWDPAHVKNGRYLAAGLTSALGVVAAASVAVLAHEGSSPEDSRSAHLSDVRVPNVQPGDDFGKALRLLKQAGLAVDAKVVTALPGGGLRPALHGGGPRPGSRKQGCLESDGLPAPGRRDGFAAPWIPVAL